MTKPTHVLILVEDADAKLTAYFAAVAKEENTEAQVLREDDA